MLKFERNMGKLDRSIRMIIGTALLLIGPLVNPFELPTILVVAITIPGVMAILSAIFSYCILYEFTGSNTLDK